MILIFQVGNMPADSKEDDAVGGGVHKLGAEIIDSSREGSALLWLHHRLLVPRHPIPDAETWNQCKSLPNHSER